MLTERELAAIDAAIQERNAMVKALFEEGIAAAEYRAATELGVSDVDIENSFYDAAIAIAQQKGQEELASLL